MAGDNNESNNIRKYQVFISSTFKDLQQHRQDAIRGIVNAGHLPIALENFTPQSRDKATVIRQAIGSSHFYVLILGHRYGSRPTEKDTKLPSYVEMELNWAEEAKLEILVFMLDEGEAQRLRNNLKRPGDQDEINNEEHYWNFRRRLTEGLRNYFYRPFYSANDIFTELYAYFSREHNVPGYIPELKDTPVSEYLHIYTRNEIVRAIVERLGQFGKVESRLAVATERKKAMAAAFDQIHGEDIQEKYDRIFIESGSTVLYIAKQLAQRLPKRVTKEGLPRPEVLTNNALAYVYLWMCANVMCHPEPEGPPDDKYGGMYGPLTYRERMPDYNMPPLEDYDAEALEMIKRMSRDIFGNPSDNTKTLILGAASGLQLTEEIRAIDQETKESVCEDKELMSNICDCRGFHVGSYRNMLFKRCLYLVKAPTIVFIHDEKVDSEVEVGKCHFIFDRKTSWPQFIIEHPLSIWIGCDRRSAKEILKKCQSSLTMGDWIFSIYGRAGKYPVIIGHNDSFRKTCSLVNVKPYSMEI